MPFLKEGTPYFGFIISVILAFNLRKPLLKTAHTTSYQQTITSLFYLLIYADGNVNDKELALGKKMCAAEGMDEIKFQAQLEKLKAKDAKETYKECLATLRKLPKADQIRSISWLCVIANSYGFMDKEEWVLIYKIYHTELGLLLDDIMKTQKDLNKIIHGRAFQSLGVRVSK